MTSDRADYGPKAPPFEVQADGTDLYAVFHGVRIEGYAAGAHLDFAGARLSRAR